jgi:hypothetical protein
MPIRGLSSLNHARRGEHGQFVINSREVPLLRKREAVPASEAPHLRYDSNPLVSLELAEFLNHGPKSPQFPFKP